MKVKVGGRLQEVGYQELDLLFLAMCVLCSMAVERYCGMIVIDRTGKASLAVVGACLRRLLHRFLDFNDKVRVKASLPQSNGEGGWIF